MLGSAIASLFAVAIGLPFLLAFLLMLPACLSVRWLLLFIHWNRKGPRSGQVSGPESVRGNDSRWLGTAWHASVIHAVLVFETKDGLNVDHFRHLLLTRVIPHYPRLKRRPVSLPLSAGIGHCWLPDSKFSIERHVFSGPSFLTNEKELQSYVSKLVKDGLPDDKPPWEFHVFQPFGDHQDTIAVLRVHQSIADGTALLRVLCHSLADSQVIEIPERPQFGSFPFCLNIFRACIVGPLTILVWLFLNAQDCNILTHRTAWTGSVTVTWSASITLPKVIRIKQVTRSTVNCVLLSALAGALRRLLQGCGVKQPPNVKIVLPMDLRNQTSSGRISSRLGNKTSPVLMPLPVAIEGCVPRLWATRKTLESLRNSADPVILYVATAALMSIGPASVARYLMDLLTDKASLQFSSLPGPTSQIFVGGKTLKGIYPLLPAQAKLGISITAMTYADQVYVSVIAERALGPAAELILEYLEDQIEILWKLLLNRRVPGEPRNSTFFTNSDVAESPVKEIASRLNLVQKEVQRLTEENDNDQDGKLSSLRAEFSELVGELRRRQSLIERDDADLLWKPRRRAFSCSTSRRQSSMSLKALLSSSRLSAHAESTYDMSEENPEKEKNEKEEEGANLLSETKQSKINLAKKRNKCDISEGNLPEDGKKRHGYVHLERAHRKISNEEGRESYGKNSFEMIPDKTKRTIRRYKEEESTPEKEKPSESESEENTIESQSDFSDTVIKISDEDMDFDYHELPRHSGPINKNIRDLYCSNYLHHKIQLLKVDEDEFSDEMTNRNYGIFHRDKFDDIDEGEIAGGVLI